MCAPVPPQLSPGSEGSARATYLFAIVFLGLLLRTVVALLAENRLDCDESTVALMSLDILEQGARPMFFYGGSYNGGAAFEAYLGAGAVALFGYSAIAFKLLAALLWTAGAAGVAHGGRDDRDEDAAGREGERSGVA